MKPITRQAENELYRLRTEREELLGLLESDHGSMIQFRDGISLKQHREEWADCKVCKLTSRSRAVKP